MLFLPTPTPSTLSVGGRAVFSAESQACVFHSMFSDLGVPQESLKTLAVMQFALCGEWKHHPDTAPTGRG